MNNREKFNLDIAINLKNYLPRSVEDKLEKNLESTLRVYIRGLDLQGLLDVAGNDHHIDKTDIESEFWMDWRPLRSHMEATYRVSVKNLWADQNYSLMIDTSSIDELPGAEYVTVHFRSVWVIYNDFVSPETIGFFIGFWFISVFFFLSFESERWSQIVQSMFNTLPVHPHFLNTGKWPSAIQVHLSGKGTAFLHSTLPRLKVLALQMQENQIKNILGREKVDKKSSQRKVTHRW